jgi:hypothetical protein
MEDLTWFIIAIAFTIIALKAVQQRRRRREQLDDGLDLDADGIALSHAEAPSSGTPLDGEPIRRSDVHPENFNVDRQAFDATAYLAANPDVAVTGVDPWEHWQSHGRYEGRRLRAD